MDASNIWDSIAKFIDTSNDIQDPKIADVTRMRKLFIQLKNHNMENSVASDTSN